ncbi:hypothetical protein AGABI1DRAFT_126087 [Agaricus bisporus var. burnettii JB137-S8]|uniref:Uncharacterized protein n=1 Tax=Agaricus bisporus var. burnettii (strain JB137-S8 / ATCC MYA-4627 / FGSC 10392) TaxID=597362 RepID=K5Y1N6_AGABU|nr:uncharacterized protein AGABI1DRAFT_126087 [Agaricus bisporus var. burnettii JB137-S8]EKM81725.1 hypothetical protein AGABI1DRAFT_126087 [Agaricus bisporus var. burnettii JB137-S8]
MSFDWIQMDSSHNKIPLNITPVLDATEVSPDSGLWLTLKLDDPNWTSYTKFTLRVSWPPSHPCDFFLKITDPLYVAPQLLRNRPLHSTYRKYVHLYAINTGVPTPSPTGEDMTWLRREPVSITLVLEPLLLGVLPQSLVPVIIALLLVIVLALVLLPPVKRYFNEIAAPFIQEFDRVKQK